jgi:predicted short-subunit dehydrogenase-like oxidoreductase (DUF2520 family)
VKTKKSIRVVLVGTGNVAWHLGYALVENGIPISQVLGRTLSAVRQMADELNVPQSGRPEDLNRDAEVCLMCISDDAILQVLKIMKPEKCLMIHTAGSISIDVFNGRALNYGVLYPFQTFTRGRPMTYKKIPILIEANSTENLTGIRQLAERISDRVIEADSSQRSYLHLAGIFAGNFSNHMYAIAEKLTLEYNLPFELLKPLIEETTAKATAMSPRQAQTGPAVRSNKGIIEKHISLLQDHPELQLLYRTISDSILKMR